MGRSVKLACRIAGQDLQWRESKKRRFPTKLPPLLRRAPRTIRSSLIAIAAASLLPTLAVVAVTGYGLRAAARDLARGEAERTLEAVQSRQRLLMKNAEQMLRTVAESNEVRSVDIPGMNRFFASLILRNTLYSTILAVDPEGYVVAAGIPVTGYSLADREYLNAARAYRGFYIGAPVVSRSTGVPIIPAALPILDPEGDVRLILVAAVRLSAIKDSYADLPVPGGAVVELLDRTGERMLAIPADAQEAGAQGLLFALERDIRVDVSPAPAFSARIAVGKAFLDNIGYPSLFWLIAISAASILLSAVLAAYLYDRSMGKRFAALTALAERIGGEDTAPHPGPRRWSELALLERTLRNSSRALRKRERELRSAAAALHASLAEKNVLIKEIHHRVKNNFQVISSLLSLQALKQEDEAVVSILEESRNRIQSMALIHEQLYQTEVFSRIDFGEYCRSLADQVEVAYRDAAPGVRTRVVAGEAPLTLDAAVPLGLALNELLSNSFKHAFPHDCPGEISVRLGVADGNRALLTVEDDGVGLPADPALRREGSLGLELVSTLALQLRGSLTSGPARCGDCRPGTRFELSFPLLPDLVWTSPEEDQK